MYICLPKLFFFWMQNNTRTSLNFCLAWWDWEGCLLRTKAAINIAP